MTPSSYYVVRIAKIIQASVTLAKPSLMVIICSTKYLTINQLFQSEKRNYNFFFGFDLQSAKLSDIFTNWNIHDSYIICTYIICIS